MVMSPERRAHVDRATERAKAVIKEGDRIGCVFDAGLKKTFIFDHWEHGCWLFSRTGAVSDGHAFHVYRLNGQPISFRDPQALGML